MNTVLRYSMHSQDSDISCLMQCSEAQPEYDMTAPGPRRCVSAFSLARQPRRSARVCPEHARWPRLTRLRPPSCPPHLRPRGACRRPPHPTLSQFVRAHIRARLWPPGVGLVNDLYRYSAAANTWTALSPSGSAPSPRFWMGFAATPDGMLYLFGGYVDYGNEGGGVGVMGLHGAGCAGCGKHTL
jgi:hypothetical protein